MASSRGGSEHSRRSSFRWRETTPFPVVKLTLRAGPRAPNRTRPVAVDEQQIEPRLVGGCFLHPARSPASASKEGS